MSKGQGENSRRQKGEKRAGEGAADCRDATLITSGSIKKNELKKRMRWGRGWAARDSQLIGVFKSLH